MSEKFYITTPIYYPSGKWHIGTCYTTVICDAIARFKRMQGMDVFYLTGTDEHGQKLEKVAAENKMPVKEYIDKIVFELQDLWKLLDISHDKFIRTTDEYHKEAVQKIFTKLYEQGDIYKDSYEGKYCTPCESFWTDTQLVNGNCPDCGRPVEIMKEDSYFFRMSKYQDRLIELIENNPEFLQPASRQKEMINNFLKPGLQDLCVSRTSFEWGVKVPFDTKHVVYVWLDALTNYITALGYGSDNQELFEKYWPCDLHMMGKEIVRFHSIIWPAILMALDLPLPKRLYGHGWLMLGSEKMSKSKGNVVDPVVLSNRYSVDAVRYYLLREVPFGQDGSYTNRAFLNRINSDLANDLGNLVSRTTAMVDQYFGGIIPEPTGKTAFDSDLITMCEGAYDKVCGYMDKLQVPEALECIWALNKRANKYIDETCPWIISKDESKRDELAAVMYNLCECIRFMATLLQPFLTSSAPKIMQKLGITDTSLMSFASIAKFGTMKFGGKVCKGDALFGRINVEKEVAELEIIAETVKKSSGSVDKEQEVKADKKSAKNAKTDNAIKDSVADGDNTITISQIAIDDFIKVDLRVGVVMSAEKVAKADKLLQLSVDLGEGRLRTIVSGIAKWYSPEDITGKSIVVVANLKPAKLRGIMSEGMILCASDDEDNLCIVAPIAPIKSGSEVR